MMLAVDALFLSDEGALEHQGVNGTDVFANDTQRNQLHGAEKEQPQNHWRQPDREPEPENQLVDEIKESHEKAKKGGYEAKEDDQAEGNLGKVGDALHREVVQRVEVVFGNAALA